MKYTPTQIAALQALHTAIVEAHAALPDSKDMALLHGLAERLVKANKGKMSEDEYSTLGGGTDKY